ncbi:hemolymph lipopolysaccharide-binding protein-like isoform X2 [Leguminivora glycinivorella]|uniref:hemolymph lipopolysaccharide-binding protein-like isoform X2 n=1 Tax=Leguminivora glycinivorella TaxID=1035111 RepID=UPI0020102936|nr:hemolymph lipopolysaccharide-binding protein-like isoform X2 [Leguminivora glycinivorella]
MCTKYFITIVLLVCAAECVMDDYRFVSEIDGYLKLHRIPVQWKDARMKCHLEGGVLASPTDANILNAMKEILTKDEEQEGPEKIYTGIHATYANGYYTTVTDYQLYNRTGSCYKFHTEGKTWPNAYKTCMAEGAYLAIINSKTESEVLKAVFSEYSHDNIPGDFHKDAASIGFTKWDEYSTGYGDWFTIHGDSLAEAGFSTFNAGEPNNIDSPELCGSVWRTGLLNDHKCGRILAFICEKPYSQTTLPEY